MVENCHRRSFHHVATTCRSCKVTVGGRKQICIDLQEQSYAFLPARSFAVIQLCILQILGGGNRKTRVVGGLKVKACTDKIKKRHPYKNINYGKTESGGVVK